MLDNAWLGAHGFWLMAAGAPVLGPSASGTLGPDLGRPLGLGRRAPANMSLELCPIKHTTTIGPSEYR